MIRWISPERTRDSLTAITASPNAGNWRQRQRVSREMPSSWVRDRPLVCNARARIRAGRKSAPFRPVLESAPSNLHSQCTTARTKGQKARPSFVDFIAPFGSLHGCGDAADRCADRCPQPGTRRPGCLALTAVYVDPSGRTMVVPTGVPLNVARQRASGRGPGSPKTWGRVLLPPAVPAKYFSDRTPIDGAKLVEGGSLLE
jgi:hypothetical protein